MHVKALSTLPSMKVAKNVLNIVVFLLRFILKLLIISLKGQGVNTLKLREKKQDVLQSSHVVNYQGSGQDLSFLKLQVSIHY